jgi:fructose-specific phosphotransferase system IIC component
MGMDSMFEPSPPSVEEMVGFINFALCFLITANFFFGILGGILSATTLYFLNKHFKPLKLEKRK